MDIKSKDLKHLVYKGLEGIFINEGFTYKKTNNEFRKVVNNFTYIFNLEQVSWSSSISIDVKLFISETTIEKILERILGKQKYKDTLGDTIDIIENSPDGRIVKHKGSSIWIYDQSEIDSAIKTLISYYEKIAKKYFTLFSNIKTIDDYMNNPPFEYAPAYIGIGQANRCMKGLIVAKLVNNPNFNELIKIYDASIKKFKFIEVINDYNMVKEYLLNNSLQQ